MSDSDTNLPAPLPCPFCGLEPTIQDDYDSRSRYGQTTNGWVECKCGAKIGAPEPWAPHAWIPKSNAINQWNSRAREEDQTIMKIRAAKWITGGDTGVSSETIWAAMNDAVADNGRYDIPYDGADFGRCYRLLLLIPEWKDQLQKVADKFPKWGPLVREWKRIEEAYVEDLRDNGRRTYDLLHSLYDECMTAAGYIKTSPSSWEKTSS